jgi:hypothetical protein
VIVVKVDARASGLGRVVGIRSAADWASDSVVVEHGARTDPGEMTEAHPLLPDPAFVKARPQTDVRGQIAFQIRAEANGW